MLLRRQGGVPQKIFDFLRLDIFCSPSYGEAGTFYRIKKYSTAAEIWPVENGTYARFFAILYRKMPNFGVSKLPSISIYFFCLGPWFLEGLRVPKKFYGSGFLKKSFFGPFGAILGRKNGVFQIFAPKMAPSGPKNDFFKNRLP